MKNRVQSNWILIFVLFLLCYLFSVGTVNHVGSFLSKQRVVFDTTPRDAALHGSPRSLGLLDPPSPLLCGDQPSTFFFPGIPKPHLHVLFVPPISTQTKQNKQNKQQTKQNPITPLIWETIAQEVLVSQWGGPGHTASKLKNQNLQNWSPDFESKFSIPSTSIGLSQTMGPWCQVCA